MFDLHSTSMYKSIRQYQQELQQEADRERLARLVRKTQYHGRQGSILKSVTALLTTMTLGK